MKVTTSSPEGSFLSFRLGDSDLAASSFRIAAGRYPIVLSRREVGERITGAIYALGGVGGTVSIIETSVVTDERGRRIQVEQPMSEVLGSRIINHSGTGAATTVSGPNDKRRKLIFNCPAPGNYFIAFGTDATTTNSFSMAGQAPHLYLGYEDLGERLYDSISILASGGLPVSIIECHTME